MMPNDWEFLNRVVDLQNMLAYLNLSHTRYRLIGVEQKGTSKKSQYPEKIAAKKQMMTLIHQVVQNAQEKSWFRISFWATLGQTSSNHPSAWT